MLSSLPTWQSCIFRTRRWGPWLGHKYSSTLVVYLFHEMTCPSMILALSWHAPDRATCHRKKHLLWLQYKMGMRVNGSRIYLYILPKNVRIKQEWAAIKCVCEKPKSYIPCSTPRKRWRRILSICPPPPPSTFHQGRLWAQLRITYFWLQTCLPAFSS